MRAQWSSVWRVSRGGGVHSTQDSMSTSLSLPTRFSSTKRGIISDVARTFDVLGWLAPTIVTMKVLYQQLWEEKLAWDEELPQPYVQQHLKWRQELHLLSSKKQPRCYFAKSATRLSIQLRGGSRDFDRGDLF